MGAGRHDDANWALIKQLRQKRASKVFTYEMKYKAGRSDGSVIIRSRGWADSPVHKPDTPFSSTLARLLSRRLSALFVDLCLHCLDARPARAVLLFFFFLLGCLVLTANLLLTFALPRRSSPLNFSFNPPALAWVSSLESNRCSTEVSLEQKCALCAGRAVLSCMSSSSLPLLESSNVFRWTESTLTSSPSQL